MIKKPSIYLFFGIIILLLSIFSSGCQPIVNPSASTSPVAGTQTTVEQTETTQTSSTITPAATEDTAAKSDILLLVICGFAGLVIGVLGYWLYYMKYLREDGDDRKDRRYLKYQNEDLLKRLKQTENEREDLKKKYEKYRIYESQLPRAEQGYYSEVIELQKYLPKLTETDFKELITEPPKEYNAIIERTRALKSIRAFFKNREDKAQELKLQCQELIGLIKNEDPKLSETLSQAISSANYDGIRAIQPVLLQIKEQLVKKPASVELRNQLASLEKSVEGIRDYSVRLIPSRMIKFANGLIESPASEKENKFREKTVREIMDLINKYLQL